MLLLTAEQRGHYPFHKPWSPYWSDSSKSTVDPYLEVVNQKENLVICYGDSWTWGDGLGNAKSYLGIDDKDFRSNHIYASYLANMLDADFVNCAIPGIFNYWIHDRLEILLNHDIERLSKQYNKIFIIVTLTELGREFEFFLYVDEFGKFYDFKQAPTPADILVQAERFDFTKLKSVQTRLPNNCQLTVARNFTTTHDVNQNILNNLAPITWAEVLFNAQNLQSIKPIALVSFGTDNFDKFMHSQNLDSQDYKQWMTTEIIPKAQKQIDLLHKSIYNYKLATKHPTPEGHKMWAEYLNTFIKNQ